jgi:hypothetical protein
MLAVTAGIDQTTAQTLFDYAVDLAALEEPGSWDSNDADPTMGTLAVRYGAEAAGRIVKDAQAAVRKLGPSVGAYLDQTGSGTRRRSSKLSPPSHAVSSVALPPTPRRSCRRCGSRRSTRLGIAPR